MNFDFSLLLNLIFLSINSYSFLKYKKVASKSFDLRLPS